MARRRRISELAGGSPPAPTSVFGPGDNNVVGGEVVFTLQADAATELAVSIPNAPIRGGAAVVGVTALGSRPIDKVLGNIGALSVARVHGPSPTEVVAGVAMANDLGLDGTFRVRYGAAEAPEAVAERLNALDEVVWAEPNRWREATIVPNDPQFASQWGLTKINCPDAWNLTTGDPSIVVAVVDTGVDLNHPDLASLLVPGQDLVDFPPGSVPRPGWVFEGDFTGVDATPQDEVGHGTHVAGTICSMSNNGVGVAGVAWNVRLMPVKVLARIRETATGRVSGAGSSANIAAGIRWAADNGARVINLSLGGYTETIVEREAVAYAMSRGVVVIAAMANDDTNTPSFPAAFPDVIAVGATDSSDNRASFSNFGPHIDVAAPGVGVQSTYWDDTYASLNGTSMASPHVAGVAALILSRNTGLSPAQVGNIIRSTAKPLRDNPGDPVPNDNYGSGLVQAAAAVEAASPVTPVASRPLTCQPSVIAVCRTFTIDCLASVVVATCPTRQITCESRLILCRSQQIICQSRQVICQPSVLTICPTQRFTCQKSILIQTCPSELVICPVTRSPGCTFASLADCPSLQCPESIGCFGGEFGPGGPGDQSVQWNQYDPYGYDPYGTRYE